MAPGHRATYAPGPPAALPAGGLVFYPAARTDGHGPPAGAAATAGGVHRAGSWWTLPEPGRQGPGLAPLTRKRARRRPRAIAGTGAVSGQSCGPSYPQGGGRRCWRSAPPERAGPLPAAGLWGAPGRHGRRTFRRSRLRPPIGKGGPETKGPPMPREPPPAAQAKHHAPAQLVTPQKPWGTRDSRKQQPLLSQEEVPPGAGRTGPRPTFRKGTQGRVSARCAGQGAPAADEAAAAEGQHRLDPGRQGRQAPDQDGSSRSCQAFTVTAATRTTGAPPGPRHPGRQAPNQERSRQGGTFFYVYLEQVFDFWSENDRKRGFST